MVPAYRQLHHHNGAKPRLDVLPMNWFVIAEYVGDGMPASDWITADTAALALETWLRELYADGWRYPGGSVAVIPLMSPGASPRVVRFDETSLVLLAIIASLIQE